MKGAIVSTTKRLRLAAAVNAPLSSKRTMPTATAAAITTTAAAVAAAVAAVVAAATATATAFVSIEKNNSSGILSSSRSYPFYACCC